MRNTLLPVLALLAATSAALAPPPDDEEIVKTDRIDRFRQLEEILPTPNTYRTASGAPGHEYWQQQVDYVIDVTLDDENQTLTGSERITYTNNSPDELRYLWLQLDANIYRPDSDAALIAGAPDFERMSPTAIKRLIARRDFDGGARITRVAGANGQPLEHTIVKTMMRVDLPEPIRPGGTFEFSVDWNYRINQADRVRGRTACEFFEDDGNFVYEIAQWFPRMCQYTDTRGWHHKQFIGRGEFSLEFGDYVVSITAPDDHVVASTGTLMNSSEVLNAVQLARLRAAEAATTPQFIVTPEEAKSNETTAPAGTKTWVFQAENVRDFAWASSRKFIWDAVLHPVGDNQVWCMSYYPNEGEPLWSRFSTHAVMHTLDVYSKYSFDYPYPTAISVNGPVGGMEYPMICFNGPRPEEDGTYSKRTKYGLISVIIHEVGHNYFPMIVNSDERQWTWMDEGLNTFVQYLAEQEWEPEYPSRRGDARRIIEFMRSENQMPIMTNSESLLQFGSNAYAKPATALNILRETILGRELFDFAFREYCRRWKFRNPQPADFFRSMEDASGVDLDWFWRGWFYTTDHVDLAIEGVRLFRMLPRDLIAAAEARKSERDADPTSVTELRNEGIARRTDRFPELVDFYNEYDELDPLPRDERSFERFLERLESDESEYLGRDDLYFYAVDLRNVGGLVMPVLLHIEYTEGADDMLRIPAEIWRSNDDRVSKLIISDREIVRIDLDPNWETADIDVSNNSWPPRVQPSRFQLFKQRDRENPMQQLEQKPGDERDEQLEDDEEDAYGG